MKTNKKGQKQVTIQTATTIDELRNCFVEFSGFSGSFNVSLEGWTLAPVTGTEISNDKYEWKQPMAVSPLFTNNSFTRKVCAEIGAAVTEISPGLFIGVVGFNDLKKLVIKDALRERLTIMVSGNGNGINGKWGSVRRTLTGLPIGTPYFHPTDEDLKREWTHY
jgi:hypothetical protein